MPSIVIRGARTHNLRNIDLELPRDRLIVFTGPVGLGQVLARLRHDLRRGPAPLRRVAVGLRAAVPVDDGKARRRLDRGPVAGDRDRAEVDLAQSALDRRHGHRDLRSPAPAVRARRHSALSGSRRRPRGADRQPDGRPGAAAAGRHAAPAARADDRRTQGRARARVRATARPGLRARAHRRHRRRARGRRRSSTRRRSTRSTRSSIASRCAPTSASVSRNRSRRRCGCRTASPASRSWTSPKREELVFSDRFACTICGYSLAELEPRLFSFNNPAGACPTCSGLGVQQFFDPARVVHHPHLSLAGGAIRGWDRRNAYYFALDAVARAALQVRHRGAVAGAAGEASEGRALRQRRGQDRLPLCRRARAARSGARTSGKASFRTWSAAIARPNRSRCARSSRST